MDGLLALLAGGMQGRGGRTQRLRTQRRQETQAALEQEQYQDQLARYAQERQDRLDAPILAAKRADEDAAKIAGALGDLRAQAGVPQGVALPGMVEKFGGTAALGALKAGQEEDEQGLLRRLREAQLAELTDTLERRGRADRALQKPAGATGRPLSPTSLLADNAPEVMRLPDLARRLRPWKERQQAEGYKPWAEDIIGEFGGKGTTPERRRAIYERLREMGQLNVQNLPAQAREAEDPLGALLPAYRQYADEEARRQVARGVEPGKVSVPDFTEWVQARTQLATSEGKNRLFPLPAGLVGLDKDLQVPEDTLTSVLSRVAQGLTPAELAQAYYYVKNGQAAEMLALARKADARLTDTRRGALQQKTPAEVGLLGARTDQVRSDIGLAGRKADTDLLAAGARYIGEGVAPPFTLPGVGKLSPQDVAGLQLPEGVGKGRGRRGGAKAKAEAPSPEDMATVYRAGSRAAGAEGLGPAGAVANLVLLWKKSGVTKGMDEAIQSRIHSVAGVSPGMSLRGTKVDQLITRRASKAWPRAKAARAARNYYLEAAKQVLAQRPVRSRDELRAAMKEIDASALTRMEKWYSDPANAQ